MRTMFLTTSASELPSTPTCCLMMSLTIGGKPTGKRWILPMCESYMNHLHINITIKYGLNKSLKRIIYESHKENIFYNK